MDQSVNSYKVDKMIKNQLTLALSTAHMPSSYPHFGSHIYMDHHLGYYILVTEPTEGTPIWLKPIMREAFNNECKLIEFHRDEDTVPKFQRWEW